MQVMVAVSAEDIRQGERNNCAKCPVGLALARTLGPRYPGAKFMAGSMLGRILPARGGLISFEMPKDAEHFMFAFDAKKPVEPFTFTIDLPDAALEAH